MSTATPKVKRPFHLIVGALRALGAEPDRPGWVIEQMERAGHAPFSWAPPDGYPDDPEYWTGFLLPRWNFAADVIDQDESHVILDPAVDDPSGSPAAIVARIDALLLQGRMSDTTRERLEAFLRSGRSTRRRVREAIGLAVASPDFQEY